MVEHPEAQDELLTPGEVAALLYVDPKTVTRWAVAGKLAAIRTPGGHRRYLRSEVQAIMSGLHPDHPDRDAAMDRDGDNSQDPVTVPSPRQVAAGGAAVEVDAERRAAAAAVVAEAVALALEAVAAEAAEAVLVTAAAVTEAAGRAADAAESARGARAFAADAAAQSVAAEAAHAATRVRLRADLAAAQVRQAATLAADELAHSIEEGTSLEARREANLLEAAVRATADATAEETTRAADAVRKADRAAAAQVAQGLAAAEEVVERDVTATADAQRELATATAAEVARKTDARAAGVALAAREAAAALLSDEHRARPIDRTSDLDRYELSPESGIWAFGGGGRTSEAAAELGHHLRAPLRLIMASVEMLEVALRESDDRLRFLVDAVTDYAIITLDPHGFIESWNTGAERLKGYTPEEALGRHFSMFYPAEDRDTGLPQRLLDRARSDGRCENTGWRVRKDGSQFWGDIVISAVHDDSGLLTGFVKVVRDLTEQHLLEVDQDSFYNAFEHDFRVPITAIKGFAELVRDADPADQEDLVDRVDSNANRLLSMVEELVHYARLRSGLVPISLQVVDMAPLARLAVANLASIAETSRVQVTATKPVRVLADTAALERVIANLVTNALKYSPGESQIDLICEQADDAGVLRIIDQGRGIDERDLSSIFLEFERGRLAHDESGTGLGLASVRRLIGLQDGTVEITSQLEVGTTVTIRLPLAP